MAHRIALDAAAASGTIGPEEDGCALYHLACRMSGFDLRILTVWSGVRRAGLLKAEPTADAGPAAPPCLRTGQFGSAPGVARGRDGS
jgi:hypothetical protein